MSGEFAVRAARAEDLTAIVDFNARLASETEGKALDRDTLVRGVSAALTDPDRLRYWVVVRADLPDRLVAQAAVTREWSDWRNGWLWWFQSVYVHPDVRARGLFRSLYAHIRSTAIEAGDVVGLRLYVEHANERAKRSYLALGMTDGGYHVFEEVWGE